MVLSVSLNLEEEDFTNANQHPDNTILVTFVGAGAAKTPLSLLKDFLVNTAKSANITIATKDLDTHYRNQEPCRVYFPLPAGVDSSLLHGRSLMKDGVRFTALIPGREPKKVFLSYLPPTISDNGLQKIVSTFIDPTKIHSQHRHINGRLDRHLIIAEIDDDEIPHFIESTDTRTSTTHRISVTTPGRLPLCAEGGVASHYASQCPTKTTPPKTELDEQTTTTTDQPTPETRSTKRQHEPSPKSSPELVIDETASTPPPPRKQPNLTDTSRNKAASTTTKTSHVHTVNYFKTEQINIPVLAKKHYLSAHISRMTMHDLTIALWGLERDIANFITELSELTPKEFPTRSLNASVVCNPVYEDK